MDTSSSFDPPSDLTGRPVTSLPASALAKTGAWLQLGLLMWSVGAHAVILGLFKSVNQIGRDEATRPVESVERAVTIAEVGICAAMIGCLLLGIAIFGQKRQPLWVKVIFGVSLFPTLGGLQLLLMNLALR